MTAQAAVAPPPRRSAGPAAARRAKDIGFRLGLFGCLGLAILLLGVLLVDIAVDGAPTHLDFITSFSSITAADRPGSSERSGARSG